MRLLFVCLGNICRSPAAEGIMQTLINQAGLSSSVHCDSAGTSAYHEGDPADSRMIQHARERGYQLTSISRGFRAPADFVEFDLILTMDESNFKNVLRFDPSGTYHHKVEPLTKYCLIHRVDEVPDPYYDEADGFRLVLDILEDACQNLLTEIRKEKRP